MCDRHSKLIAYICAHPIPVSRSYFLERGRPNAREGTSFDWLEIENRKSMEEKWETMRPLVDMMWKMKKSGWWRDDDRFSLSDKEKSEIESHSMLASHGYGRLRSSFQFRISSVLRYLMWIVAVVRCYISHMARAHTHTSSHCVGKLSNRQGNRVLAISK